MVAIMMTMVVMMIKLIPPCTLYLCVFIVYFCGISLLSSFGCIDGQFEVWVMCIMDYGLRIGWREALYTGTGAARFVLLIAR